MPTPGPIPWLGGFGVGADDQFHVGPPSGGEHSVVGREVVDAFELIWPTGEIDEQFLGGPLSEMPAPGAPYGEVQGSDDPTQPPLPMTVRLKPLTAPPRCRRHCGPSRCPTTSSSPSNARIAAIGPELTVVEEPLPAPRVPEQWAVPVAGVAGNASLTAADEDDLDPYAASDPSDARRSALKRLIGGLRRR